MIALLDVNVLLALLDAAHVHHARARDWLLAQPDPTWASCPITQNGFIRVISQEAYPGSVRTHEARNLLALAAASPHHRFWPDDVNLLDGSTLNPDVFLGPKQVTDVYLLALAVRHNGRLVALDRSIPLTAVLGAKPHHLVVL